MRKLGVLFLTLLLMCVVTSAQAEYLPGVYTAQDQGFGGVVSVMITVDEQAVTEVDIQGDDETPAIGGAALDVLSNQLLTAQSSEIDGVAGATVTSNAVRNAAEKALMKAAGKEAVTAAALIPGTYTSTQEGFQHCGVTVSVTVDETSIQDVQIVELTDHPITMAGVPCEKIPAEIISHQSYNVDGVTGATFTSNAIKLAVRDCLDQAGGSEAFSEPVITPERVAGEDVTTDILVIGGGGAGMMAALEASMGEELGSDSGYAVTLVEKAGFLGGNTSCSGGGRSAYGDVTGKYDEAWLETALEKEKAAYAPYMELEINEGLLRNEIRASLRANAILDEIGVVSLNAEDVWGIPYGMRDQSDVPLWLYAFGPKDHEEPKWFGSYMAYVVRGVLPERNVDVRLETAATKLLTNEQGDVIGAVVQDKTSVYNIYAKKVILATGGFSRNKELIAEYAPDFVEAEVFSAGTNTGDGLIMAREIGAVPIGDKMFGHIGCDGIEGARPDYSVTFYYGSGGGGGKFMYTDMNGKRFCDELKNRYVVYHDLLKMEVPQAWGIVDSDNVDAYVLEESTSKYVKKADTLEELAEIIGVPADALMETVAYYNESYDLGEDREFGTPLEMMDRLDTAPYYAFIIKPVTMTSMVGLKVDDSCRVVREDGEPIGNLFAAGDMVLGGNFLSYYLSYRGVGTAVYTGNLSAQIAKGEIAQ